MIVSAEMRDQELIERARRRDHEAMAAIYGRYARSVYSFAVSILREQRAAEGVVQDTFLTFWQRPASYVSERGAFGPWLLWVARNRAIDHLRRSSHEQLDGDDPLTSLELRIVDPEPEVSDLVWSRTVAKRVRAAVQELNGPQREVIELAYFRGMT
jgi:RNA polymerase sigma-70 factor, ECF subfamily